MAGSVVKMNVLGRRRPAVLTWWALVALVASGMSVPGAAERAEACAYLTLRDAAYDEGRDVHRLCVVGASESDETARAVHERLASWLESDAGGLNLSLHYLAADDTGIDWPDYGVPSAPPSTPVTFLAGRRTFERKSFYIQHWEPAPTVEELEVLLESPARDAIRRDVGRKLAVLVHVPARGAGGADAGAHKGAGNSAPDAVIRQVVAEWEAKDEWPGLSVVRVDREDARERLMLVFAGIGPDGPDWLGVVFGRGKFMAPLEGDAITAERINERLETLIEECTCMQKPASMGVDVPMVWNEAAEATVVLLKQDEADAQPGGSGDDAPTVATALAAQAADPPAPGRTVLAATVWTFAALAAAVTLAAAIVWRRSRAAT